MAFGFLASAIKMYLDDSCEEQESFIGSALQEAEMFRSATIFSLNLRDDGSGLKNILLPGLDDRENRPILAKLQSTLAYNAWVV